MFKITPVPLSPHNDRKHGPPIIVFTWTITNFHLDPVSVQNLLCYWAQTLKNRTKTNAYQQNLETIKNKYEQIMYAHQSLFNQVGETKLRSEMESDKQNQIRQILKKQTTYNNKLAPPEPATKEPAAKEPAI